MRAVMIISEYAVAFALIQRCLLLAKEHKAGAASVVASGQY